MKITNQTKITFITFRDYYFLNLRQNRLIIFSSILGVIATIMIVIALGYNVLNYFLNAEPLTFQTFLPSIILSGVYLVYYGFIYSRIYLAYNQNKPSFAHPIHYTFEDTRVIVSVAGGPTRERSSFRYEEILGVFQNKKYLVLAFGKNRSTLIRKDAFKPEEKQIIEEKLREIMEKLTEKQMNIE